MISVWISIRIMTEHFPLSSFRFYNANVPQNLSDEELEALDRLSKNKDLLIQKADKGNSVEKLSGQS